MVQHSYFPPNFPNIQRFDWNFVLLLERCNENNSSPRVGIEVTTVVTYKYKYFFYYVHMFVRSLNRFASGSKNIVDCKGLTHGTTHSDIVIRISVYRLLYVRIWIPTFLFPCKQCNIFFINKEEIFTFCFINENIRKNSPLSTRYSSKNRRKVRSVLTRFRLINPICRKMRETAQCNQY